MPASGSPKMRVVPADGRSKPAATLSSVDFPQPVGPTIETNSPSSTASVTSFTAVYDRPSPPRAAKVQVIDSNETAAVTLLVLGRGLPRVRVVERLVQVHLPGGLHRRLELDEHLVDVLRGLHRHLAVLGVADHVLEERLLVERRVRGLVGVGHEID